MPMDQSGPLGPQDLDAMKAQLGKLDIVDREIEKAQRAGIDMTNQAKTAADQREQLKRLMQAYFPGR